MSADPAVPVTGTVDHLRALRTAASRLEREAAHVESWGHRLADALLDGRRLLAAGNGGSAAEAQHLTAELVGRFRDERAPFAAVALHSDTSTLTAVANDYGYDEVFARQVRAHGRAGDVVVLLTTSGRSANLLRAAEAAAAQGCISWALTGPAPNPLTDVVDDAVCVEAPTAATVQELHLVLVHALCLAFDAAVATRSARPVATGAVHEPRVVRTAALGVRR